MDISLNWLKDYIDLNEYSPQRVGEILTDIGLEVEGMEKKESVKGGLRGVIVGKVKTCGRHPNADRLSVTTVDIGRDEDLNIVCGAPNVAAGQKVMVATVGTTLYGKDEEGFLLKKTKIRGEVSEGMICAEDELGLGDDHSGIIVLPDVVKIGTPAADYYDIQTDYVYDIGLTPNRSDATCHLGVAKDLAAYLKINTGHTGRVNIPTPDDFSTDAIDNPIAVEVENTEACPRYAGVLIRNIQVKESPAWLKNRLLSIGLRPINNVVDITNFVLHEFGQPLHAFDASLIKGRKVLVKTLPDGSPFTTLDEVERKLDKEDLMICNGASEGMCIAGVFGGIGTGVTENTTEVFLESAHFNAKWVRRTSMRHLLRTDAAKVFEKGSDPNVVIDALKRAGVLIKELTGGTIASEIVDVYPKPIEPAKVRVSYKNINRLIGVDIPEREVKNILSALEMNIVEESNGTFIVAIPTNKADVLREADVIEEVLRIYGFNKVPMPVQIRSAVNFSEYPDPVALQNTIGDLLASNGFHEMMALSLSQSKYYRDVLPDLEGNLLYVNNTSNIHLDIMRPEMLISALEAVLHNQNRQQTDVKLFEFGKSYRQDQGKIVEKTHLTLTVKGKKYEESWLQPDEQELNYFSLKAYVRLIMDRLGLSEFQTTAIVDNKFAFGLRYHRGDQVLVEFGKINPKVLKKLDIKSAVFYAEFQWENILKALKKYRVRFEELNKFPKVRRDLALVVENSVKFKDIVEIARKADKKLIKEINLFDVYENEAQLGKGKKSYAVSFILEDPSKTLKIKEVDKVMNKLILKYEKQLKAIIRR